MRFFAFAILLITFMLSVWADETCTMDGKHFKKGETYQPADDCKILECNGEKMEVSQVCRPLNLIATDCRYVGFDYSKPYPDCCVRLDCDGTM